MRRFRASVAVTVLLFAASCSAHKCEHQSDAGQAAARAEEAARRAEIAAASAQEASQRADEAAKRLESSN